MTVTETTEPDQSNWLQFVNANDESDPRKHIIVYDGYEVPYIHLHSVSNAEGAKHNDVPKFETETSEYWNLSLDNRFGHTFSCDEIKNLIFILANAMAVSGGFTCFGKHSRPINPFQKDYYATPNEEEKPAIHVTVTNPGQVISKQIANQVAQGLINQTRLRGGIRNA